MSEAQMNEKIEEMKRIEKEGLRGQSFSKGLPLMMNLWINRNKELE